MKTLKRTLPLLLALIMAFCLFAGTSAFAAGETVKIICPYGAGGVADLVTREYAKAANNVQSDYNFVVENLTGGDGFVAIHRHFQLTACSVVAPVIEGNETLVLIGGEHYNGACLIHHLAIDHGGFR